MNFIAFVYSGGFSKLYECQHVPAKQMNSVWHYINDAGLQKVGITRELFTSRERMFQIQEQGT